MIHRQFHSRVHPSGFCGTLFFLLLFWPLSPALSEFPVFTQVTPAVVQSDGRDVELHELRQRVAVLEKQSRSRNQEDELTGHLVRDASGAGEYQLRESRYPTVHFGGFLQFDSVWFGESEATRAVYGNIADSTAVRRARLAASGDINADVGYKLDLDFAASGHPSFRDTIVEFSECRYADRLVIGFFKTPFQLDALTSSKDFTFAERAPFFTFAPFRQIGIGLDGMLVDERATWAIDGFRSGTDGFAVAQSDDGYGIATRMTFLLCFSNGGRRLLHAGFGYGHLAPAGNVVQYDAQLGFFVDEEPGGKTLGIPSLVDTGLIPASRVNIFNCELAGNLGSMHYQSEFGYTMVDQIGGPPLSFYGGYGQLGWFLTGETRPYNRTRGVFTRIDPKQSVFDGGLGAWELAFRATYLNLNDENIQGGRLNSIEVVVNWYLSNNIDLKFDCVRGFIANPTEGDLELDICGVRLQLVY